MSKRNYLRLNVVEFGRQLLRTGDLDPIYLALNKVSWDYDTLCRWLVGYIAFYHAGVASWLSEREDQAFWDAIMLAARNEAESPIGGRWPRGRERRHFRGDQAVQAVQDWGIRAGAYAEVMIVDIKGEGNEPFAAVARRARKYRGIGQWMAFKIVDLLDACLGAEVDQRDVEPFLYDTPRESFLRMYREDMGQADSGVTEERAAQAAMQWLRSQLLSETIPHKPGKRLDNFCLETIACKHKSHLNGHYPPGNDIAEIQEGLAPWVQVSRAAEDFLAAMPRDPNGLPL